MESEKTNKHKTNRLKNRMNYYMLRGSEAGEGDEKVYTL